METTQKMFWRKQLEITAEALHHNGFETALVDTIDQAVEQTEAWIAQLKPQTVGTGGSQTLDRMGIPGRLRARTDLAFLDTHNPDLTPAQRDAFRKEALTCSLFLSGVNAVTTEGTLLWLDMIGNRIAPIAYGPEHVILIAGRNKLVSTPEEGMQRIKTLAAPMNTLRLSKLHTPCQSSGVCHDCSSPDRICNTWLIMERCFPTKRIHVLLVNEELGF